MPEPRHRHRCFGALAPNASRRAAGHIRIQFQAVLYHAEFCASWFDVCKAAYPVGHRRQLLWKFNFKVFPTHQQSFIAASLVPKGVVSV